MNQYMLPLVTGLAGALIACLFINQMRKRRGEVFQDEMTRKISGHAGEIGYVALVVTTVAFWVKDIGGRTSAGLTMKDAVTASPFTWLLLVGFVSWFGAMFYQSWRAGVYKGPGGNSVFVVLSMIVLFMGFLPLPWAAMAQLVAALALILGSLVWFAVKRTAP